MKQVFFVAALAVLAVSVAAQSIGPRTVVVSGDVKRADTFTTTTKSYVVGKLTLTVAVDSDLDRFLASQERQTLLVAFTVGGDR